MPEIKIESCIQLGFLFHKNFFEDSLNAGDAFKEKWWTAAIGKLNNNSFDPEIAQRALHIDKNMKPNSVVQALATFFCSKNHLSAVVDIALSPLEATEKETALFKELLCLAMNFKPTIDPETAAGAADVLEGEADRKEQGKKKAKMEEVGPVDPNATDGAKEEKEEATEEPKKTRTQTPSQLKHKKRPVVVRLCTMCSDEEQVDEPVNLMRRIPLARATKNSPKLSGTTADAPLDSTRSNDAGKKLKGPDSKKTSRHGMKLRSAANSTINCSQRRTKTGSRAKSNPGTTSSMTSDSEDSIDSKDRKETSKTSVAQSKRRPDDMIDQARSCKRCGCAAPSITHQRGDAVKDDIAEETGNHCKQSAQSSFSSTMHPLLLEQARIAAMREEMKEFDFFKGRTQSRCHADWIEREPHGYGCYLKTSGLIKKQLDPLEVFGFAQKGNGTARSTMNPEKGKVEEEKDHEDKLDATGLALNMGNLEAGENGKTLTEGGPPRSSSSEPLAQSNDTGPKNTAKDQSVRGSEPLNIAEQDAQLPTPAQNQNTSRIGIEGQSPSNATTAQSPTVVASNVQGPAAGQNGQSVIFAQIQVEVTETVRNLKFGVPIPRDGGPIDYVPPSHLVTAFSNKQ